MEGQWFWGTKKPPLPGREGGELYPISLSPFPNLFFQTKHTYIHLPTPILHRNYTYIYSPQFSMSRSVPISYRHGGSVPEEVSLAAGRPTEFEIEKLTGDNTVGIEHWSDCSYKIGSVGSQT